MKVIYKYLVRVEGDTDIVIPYGSEFLSVQVQGNGVQSWFLVRPNELEVERYRFKVIGTGHYISHPIEKSNFVGTIQLYGGEFVGHVFMRKMP